MHFNSTVQSDIVSGVTRGDSVNQLIWL